MESTLVLLKPDAIERQLVGAIISRFENKGLIITAMKTMHLTPEIAKEHYAEHVGKHFYPELERYITSGPVIAMIVTGMEAITVVRTLMGPTNSVTAPPGTIRGDFGLSTQKNLVHASDSPDSAMRELDIFFPQFMSGQ